MSETENGRGKVVRGLTGLEPVDNRETRCGLEFECSGCGQIITLEEEDAKADHYSCDCGLTTIL